MPSSSAPPRRRLSRLLRLDAAFELALGVVLVAGSPVGVARAVGLPGGVVLVFGALLVPAAALLWREADAPDLARVRALAAVNALTASASLSWLAAAGDSFSSVGTALVAIAAAGLFTLAIAQARAAAAPRAAVASDRR